MTSIALNPSCDGLFVSRTEGSDGPDQYRDERDRVALCENSHARVGRRTQHSEAGDDSGITVCDNQKMVDEPLYEKTVGH